MGLALTDAHHLAATVTGDDPDRKSLDHVGAVGLPVVAGQRSGNAVQLRRRCFHHQRPVDQGVDGIKITGVAISLDAPDHGCLQTGGARLLIVARSHGGITQRRIFQFGDHQLIVEDADGHGTGHGGVEIFFINLMGPPAQIENTAVQGGGAGLPIDGADAPLQDIAVGEERIGDSTDLVIGGGLQLVQLGTLQSGAGLEQVLDVAFVRVEAVVVVLRHHGHLFLPLKKSQRIRKSRGWRWSDGWGRCSPPPAAFRGPPPARAENSVVPPATPRSSQYRRIPPVPG